jgi:thiol-disulfide isomerase/thioredoxin
VRRDEKLSDSVRRTPIWGGNGKYKSEVVASAGSDFKALIGMSFSGKERNRLFLSRRAERFTDLSAISGLDNIADSRVFAIWDFDRDGWQDIAVANSNAPLLSIYHNDIAVTEQAREAGKMIAIRFVGGNQSAEPNSQFGCRDGYGTKVRITDGSLNLIREHRCGEGMAGQNSATMFIGIGSRDSVQSVAVEWLSGVRQTLNDVPAGTLLTVYENPEDSPNKMPEVRTPYFVGTDRDWLALRSRADSVGPVPEGTLRFDDMTAASSPAAEAPELFLYTTMATWCEACKRHLPQLEQLRRKVNPEQVAMYAVPVDKSDTSAKLTSYVERYQPAYELLKDLPIDRRDGVQQLVADALETDALPATVVTNADGKVLLITGGLPTTSQIRILLADQVVAE